ncbi:MAG TPA: histidinol-phosphate transaminase [Bryobacteraceae bacterium]|nr:histidinol-phosphate transaminase [Bryobacteraceae bacterium]
MRGLSRCALPTSNPTPRPNPRRAVREMAPYSPPSAGRAGKLRLDFNENTVGCSPRVVEFLKKKLCEDQLSIYPEYTRVKPALETFFKVSPGELLLTNGTDEAIQVLVNTYVDDGDEVIVLRPSYAMYRFYAEVAGAKILDIDYEPNTLAFPMQALLKAITPATRAILISNPNNPTGTAIDVPAIKQILDAAPHAAVLIDEAYYEFCEVTALPSIPDYPNLFVSRTFSKVYGMAAMRIGCLFSQASNVEFLHKAQSPYSVNMLAALAAEAAVQDTEYVANYVAEALAARATLQNGFDKLGIKQAASSANFVLGYFGNRAIEVRDALRDKAILVRDRSYEIPGGVRITAGTREQAQAVLKELEKIW